MDMYGWVGRWMDDEWMDGWMDMDGWIDMDGRMGRHGWMDGCTSAL